MKYVIDIAAKESIDWLKNLINNSFDKVKRDVSPTLQSAYNQIEDWHQALADIKPLQENVVPVVKQVRDSKSSKSRKKKEKDPFICSTHDKRQLNKRAPSDNCSTCWGIYKTLKGADQYNMAYRRFTLNQKAKGLK